jgi:hypothetical protein
LRKRISVLVILAAMGVPSLTLAADHTGFQLQVDGLFSSPAGSLPSADGARLSSVFASGGGGALTASMGFSPRIHGAVRVGFSRGNDKGSVFQFQELQGATLVPGSGPYDLRRDLGAVPLHVLVQYRRTAGDRIGYSVEAGLGVISFTEKMRLRDGSGELLELVGYQREPSYTVGCGIALPIAMNFDLVAGAHYDGTRTGAGAVWAKGDDPAFFTGSVGIRYPRVTH